MSDLDDNYDDEQFAYRHERLMRLHNPALAREVMRESEMARLVATFDSADGNCDDGAKHPADCFCAWCEVDRQNAEMFGDGSDHMTEAEREEMREEKHRAESRVDGCHKKYWSDEI